MAIALCLPADMPAHDRDLILEFVLSAEVVDATRLKYLKHLSTFSAWLAEHGEGPGLQHASPADVHRFMAALLDTARPGGALAPNTRRNYLASLRSFYRYCIAVRLTPADPTARIRPPRRPPSRGLHLSADELRALLAISTCARDRIQTYLLVYTGARVGELQQLRWNDVDFKERTLRFTGKRGTVRTITIHPVLMSELRRWLVHQDLAAEQPGPIAQARQDPETDFVLLTRRARPVRASTIYRQLRRRACLAGLYVLPPKGREQRSAVTPHCLRRSFATLLLNDGQPIDAVADVLGHKSIDTTRTHYAFSSTARQRATVEAFNI